MGYRHIEEGLEERLEERLKVSEEDLFACQIQSEHMDTWARTKSISKRARQYGARTKILRTRYILVLPHI